jgi:hypothetical protein
VNMKIRVMKSGIAALVLLLIVTAVGPLGTWFPEDYGDDWRGFLLPSEQSVLDPLVLRSLSTMEVTERHLREWHRDSPLAALRHIWDMHPDTQRSVAAVARYIRKQNRAIDARTAWIEAAAFVHYSDKYGVPLDLAVAVGNAESHFNPSSRSNYGAMGVMQVVWDIHSHLLQANGIAAPEDLHDPDRGVAAGCLLLSRYMRVSDNTRKALLRYSGGSIDTYWNKITRNLSKIREHAVALGL